jgi:glycosyltransferase involved in cell wall biosynthesis
MRLVFIDGTKGFSPTRMEKQATGGILSSLTILPRLLAKFGHDVRVKCAITEPEVVGEVRYLTLMDEVASADIVVFNRNVISRELVAQAKAAGARVVWWLHDVVDPRYLLDDAFRAVDGIVALSKYCRDTYSVFYGIEPKKFAIIPNGVDKTVFFPGPYGKRKHGLLIYASAPIKGVKPLGFLAANLKRHNPEAELRMYASQRLHDKMDDALIKFQLDRAREQGCTILDPIPQHELAQVMREAWLLLMPNSYPEICSNLLLQARASGLPVVASPTGSIPEFLRSGEHGTITRSGPEDLYFWWHEFAGEAMKLVLDHEQHKRMSEATVFGVDSWEVIAEQWHDYLCSVAK